jgi:hypothetical protein
MTAPEQLQTLRDALKAGRLKEDDPTLKYGFRQGWNEGVEFAQNQVNKIFGKEMA